MPNGPLDNVEDELLTHNSDNKEINLLMKGTLLIIHQQKAVTKQFQELPCVKHDKRIGMLMKFMWTLIGMGILIGVIIGALQIF